MLSLAVSCASEVDVEKLYVQSNSDDYEERVEARQKLSRLVSEGKVEPFAHGLGSVNAETRVQSILHLMAIRSDEARRALVGELEFSRRFNVFYNPIRLVPSSLASDSRIMIARIIFLNGGDPKAVEILDATYGKEPDAEARVGTLYALGALADPKAIPALRRGLADPELKGVRAALEGLNQLQVPDLAGALLKGLSDSNEQVRFNAATVLSGFPGEETATALMEAVRKDPSQKVRMAALGSVAYAGAPDAFDFILGILKDPGSTQEMKDKAASALRSLSNQDFGRDAARWSQWNEQSRGKVGRP